MSQQCCEALPLRSVRISSCTLLAFQHCQLISPLKRIFLPSLKYIYIYIFLRTLQFCLPPHKPPVLAKKYALALIFFFFFLSRGITPPVSAEVRFGCRDYAGSTNSNLIPFQAGLILSLLVCVMLGPIGTSTLP